VSTTVREANDRGYDCLILEDCGFLHSGIPPSRDSNHQSSRRTLWLGKRFDALPSSAELDTPAYTECGERAATEASMDNVWIEKLAIQELCSRYCQTIDAQDSDGWARCFVPQGAFEFDQYVVRGYEALREYADAHRRVLRGRHMTLNHLYDVHGDQATGRATTVVSIATPGGYKIMGQGVYEDDLVKVSGEWKIRHRCVKNDHLVSDPENPINLADRDVAALVQVLIDTAKDLGQRTRSSG
jgi:hypothetical protein